MHRAASVGAERFCLVPRWLPHKRACAGAQLLQLEVALQADLSTPPARPMRTPNVRDLVPFLLGLDFCISNFSHSLEKVCSALPYKTFVCQHFHGHGRSRD